MFNTKQTRLALFLTIIITILLCIIGLNWDSEDKEKIKMEAVLESPMLEEEAEPEPVPETAVKEKPDHRDEVEVDEGETIILE